MKFELKKRGYENPFLATYYKTDEEITAEKNLKELRDEIISRLRKPLGLVSIPAGAVHLLSDMTDSTYVVMFLEKPTEPFISYTPPLIEQDE